MYAVGDYYKGAEKVRLMIKYSEIIKKLDCDIEEALITDEGLILIGSPNSEDGLHNCDAAGCSSRKSRGIQVWRNHNAG